MRATAAPAGGPVRRRILRILRILVVDDDEAIGWRH